MILPQLPAKVDKRTNQINRFLGLNWTENYTSGELRDSIGLSSDAFPALSQRPGITATEDQSGITDIFEYDNHVVLVKNTGKLYIGGDEVTTVRTDSLYHKQFTVINKKLIVWPDGIIIDLENENSVKQMSDPVSITTSLKPDWSNPKQITGNSLKTTSYTYTSAPSPANVEFPVGTNVDGVYLYCYGTDEDAVQACFKNGEWDIDALNVLKRTVAINYDPVALDAGEPYADFYGPAKGMIVFLNASDGLVTATTGTPDESLYRTDGNYYIVTTIHACEAYNYPTTTTYKAASASINMYTFASIASTVVTTVTDTDIMFYAGNANDPNWAYLSVEKNNTTYTGYCRRSDIHLRKSLEGGNWNGQQRKVKWEPLFDGVYLHGGYKIGIEGTKFGFFDKDGVTVIGATANKLMFADGTFDVQEIWYYEVPASGLAVGTHVFKADGNYYTVSLAERAVRDDVIYIKPKESDTVYVWDKNAKEIKAKYLSTKSSTGSGEKTMTKYIDANPSGTVTIKKIIPALDYICESNNRLWGASNDDKTIYASALGDPTDWWSTGLDDSSYQLAVASEDPFTAIIGYGGAVLAWKEYSLTKILGSYPSQYYSNEYKYAGVQNGSYQTLQIINGALYYKGVHGFYAYQSTPSLISEKLGDPMLYGYHSGNDGKKYYCCVRDAVDIYSVLVYDVEKGIWLKESYSRVDGYIYDSVAKTCGFVSNGELRYYDQSSNERVEWMAEFCPFIEGTSSNSVWTVLMGKKGYTRLILFADMAENSFIKIELKEDNKPWREIGTKRATYPIMWRQPIRLGRCAKAQLRLSGRGRVVIRAINREYLVGSDK